jgi:Domain of unknown function (DUF1707)/Pentapeptide repeats (8 copies)
VVSDGGMRASDSDREKVVEILGAAYTEGRLTLDEFDDRTTTAYAAKTWGDLRSLTSDLPAGANLAGANLGGANLGGANLGGPPPDGLPAARRTQDSVPAGPPLPPVRRPAFIPMLPVIIVFLIVATSAHAAVLLVLLLPAFIMLLMRRRHGPGHGRRGS